VSGVIRDLVSQAGAEQDDAASGFLQWFVAEQVEEESTAEKVVGKLKLAKGEPDALAALDRELGQRTFTPPPAAGQGAEG